MQQIKRKSIIRPAASEKRFSGKKVRFYCLLSLAALLVLIAAFGGVLALSLIHI